MCKALKNNLKIVNFLKNSFVQKETAHIMIPIL